MRGPRCARSLLAAPLLAVRVVLEAPSLRRTGRMISDKKACRMKGKIKQCFFSVLGLNHSRSARALLAARPSEIKLMKGSRLRSKLTGGKMIHSGLAGRPEPGATPPHPPFPASLKGEGGAFGGKLQAGQQADPQGTPVSGGMASRPLPANRKSQK